MSEQQLDIQNHRCAASIPLGFQSSHRLSLLFTQVIVIDFHVWGTRQKRYRVGNELSLINFINVELYNYQRICVCVTILSAKVRQSENHTFWKCVQMSCDCQKNHSDPSALRAPPDSLGRIFEACTSWVLPGFQGCGPFMTYDCIICSL